LDVIYETDRRTDGRTDGQTEPALAIARSNSIRHALIGMGTFDLEL